MKKSLSLILALVIFSSVSVSLTSCTITDNLEKPAAASAEAAETTPQIQESAPPAEEQSAPPIISPGAEVSLPDSEPVPTPSLPLTGYKIGIDAGHQGKGNYGKEPNAPGSGTMKTKVSSGTQGRFTRVPEYEVNLAVALLLKEKLIALGAEVVMTRETNDIDITNVERTILLNEAGVDLSIKIHADGSEDPAVQGAWMLIPANSISDAINERSRHAAEIVQAEFVAETGAKDRGLQPRKDITGFNWSAVPVILVEMGYMTNEKEDRLLATDEYREKCAQGLANGVMEWVKYI
jgi:N-acetylmuramoyl-L-alanine amidase